MNAHEWARRHPDLAAELDSVQPAAGVGSAGCSHPLDELVGALAVVGVALVVLLYGRYALEWGGDGVAIAIGAVGVLTVGVLVEFAVGVLCRVSSQRYRKGMTDEQ